MLIAPTFLRKIKAAVPERAEQVEIFEDLSINLPPQSVATWTVAVEAWEKDKVNTNPFVSVAEGAFAVPVRSVGLILSVGISGHRARRQTGTSKRGGA